MEQPLNIYCDESTHLPNDGMPFMVLGAIACTSEATRRVSQRMFEIRAAHGVPHDFEIKWSKVSPAMLPFYADLVNFFFDNDDLSFRAVVAPKAKLNHGQFSQTHDDWYYKMMFLLVRNILKPQVPVHIYLDKKDTRSGIKVEKLHKVVANSTYDFDRRIVRRVQIVESHHVNQLQLADLLIGATNYANRKLRTSSAKLELVELVKKRSDAQLTRSTLPSEEKFNVFVWRARAA
ncbi:DUF3800 domain-containing protein [Arthrobacter sp. 2RAF22]|uniref:DUF3800 domain-containing protein n=1 Tax=Arthrobacter sp. 2RAF22 TaxID=3232996 RepID=UPI003F91EC5C